MPDHYDLDEGRRFLIDLDYSATMAAIHLLADTEGTFPGFATIRAVALDIMAGKLVADIDAWRGEP